MLPTQIKLLDSTTLSLQWDDGHSGRITLRTLRDNCPCASCQGETVLLKTYLPVIQPEMPGKYQLAGADTVGSYAIGMSWADGHRTGIYTFARLRDLCECEECLRKKS
jgi:DUF971 family protein